MKMKARQKDSTPHLSGESIGGLAGMKPVVLPLRQWIAVLMSDTIFESEILEASGICNNCFRRTHDEYEFDYPNRVENRPITGTALLYERLIKRHEVTEKVYPQWEEAAHHPPGRNACECGAISRSLRERPLSKKGAIENTKRLSERLDERSIVYDEDALFGHVRREKAKEHRQHEDEEIFKEAVSKAVSHGHAKQATA